MKSKIRIIFLVILFLSFLLFLGYFNKDKIKLWYLSNKKSHITVSISPKTIITPSGLEAYFLSEHSSKVISLSFILKNGSVNDAEDKKGLSYLASGLLDEGAGEYDSKAFRNLLDLNAISLSFSAAQQNFEGSMQTLSDNKELAFELLRLSITKPRFDDEAVERIKSQIISSIKKDEESPDFQALSALKKHIFKGHPLSLDIKGTPNDVIAITKSDLQEFVQNSFAKDNIIIAIAGDISESDAIDLIEKTFKDLPLKSKYNEVLKAKINLDGKDIFTEYKIPQTIAVFAQKGLSRNDKDFYPAFIMNYILGGGSFSSRLMEEIRTKKGLAYGVNTDLMIDIDPPLIIGTVATNKNDFEKSKKIIKKEWEKMSSSGITEKELKEAKRFLIGSYPLRFASIEYISSMLALMKYYNLGEDFLIKRNNLINEVTLSKVNKVAGKILKPKTLVFSIVGEKELK